MFSRPRIGSPQQPKRPEPIGIGRVFRRLERDLNVRLRREIVDLVRLRFLNDADDIGRIGHISIVEIERNPFLVRILDQMIDALGIEG